MIDFIDGSNFWKVSNNAAGPPPATSTFYRQIHYRGARHHLASTVEPQQKWIKIGMILLVLSGAFIFPGCAQHVVGLRHVLMVTSHAR